MALVKIADSKFQELLISQAKSSGKLSTSYVLPEVYKNNTPDQIRRKLAGFKKDELFPAFPFGTAFTNEEQVLGKALKSLKKRMGNNKSKIYTIVRSLMSRKVPSDILPYLKRMQLDQPKNFEERLYQKLLVHELKLLL
ncbi:MAG: methionine aminopeptidase [Saprospiraceae bacterium]